MNTALPPSPPPPPEPPDLAPPVTEAELHANLDGELPAQRQHEVEAYLAQHPADAARLADYRTQKAALRALFDPVLDEAVPERLLAAARPRTPWWAQRWVAGVVLAVIGGAGGWALRGQTDAQDLRMAAARAAGVQVASADEALARRAAVAHTVFSPDPRRAVELDAAHQDQLITWLSRRMGAPMNPPHLQALGYALEGGRLLPGGEGPMAQFMYADAAGRKLTVYVSRELAGPSAGAAASATASGAAPGVPAAFRFAQEGAVNVFYWVEGRFGYAIAAGADRAALADVSQEVYRQLGAPEAAASAP